MAYNSYFLFPGCHLKLLAKYFYDSKILNNSFMFQINKTLETLPNSKKSQVLADPLAYSVEMQNAEARATAEEISLGGRSDGNALLLNQMLEFYITVIQENVNFSRYLTPLLPINQIRFFAP